jgi:putative restriction endonuclease
LGIVDGCVAITDNDWLRFLRSRAPLPEVNFWRPGGNAAFRALSPGEPLLFKLHRPENFVVGGGFFAHFAMLPVSLAWETFSEAKGARTFAEMRERVERYRRVPPDPRANYQIGCVILEDPFFLPNDNWLTAPADFHLSTQGGKTYDLSCGIGKELWANLDIERQVATAVAEQPAMIDGPLYGAERLTKMRLHQGAFRIIVTDAYERRCAITGEKALPVLEAAHIRPVANGGEHRADNGILLRSDVHTLFDRGYIGVKPDLKILVSSRLKTDFDNGETYYQFGGQALRDTSRSIDRPSPDCVEWHCDMVYRG